MGMMKQVPLLIFAAGFAAGISHAALTWPNCTDAVNTEF
jgi:hypothetical protein